MECSFPMESVSRPISSAVDQVISSKQDVFKLLKHMLTPYYKICVLIHETVTWKL